MRTKLKVSDRWLELNKKTWYEIIEMQGKAHADVEAIIFRDQYITYKEYLEWTNRVAKGLYAIGVRPKDHVGLWMTNCPEWLYSRFALCRLGAIMVPLTTRYKANDLEYVLWQSDCKFLMMEDMFLGKINAMEILRGLAPELDTAKPSELNLTKFPLLKAIVNKGGKHPGCLTWEEMIEMGRKIADKDVGVKSSPDDTVHIMYTSGTTGFPKGVMTSYRMNVSMYALVSELTRMQVGDRFLSNIPLFGNIGLTNAHAALLQGATLVMSETFDAEQTLQMIDKYKITHVMLLPTMAISMLAHSNFDKYDHSTLRFIACGGSGVPAGLYQNLREKFGLTYTNNAYGLVEASGLSTWVPDGATIEQMEKTVGLPLPPCEVAILDPETSKLLPVGEEGEICMKESVPGTHFMQGYYNKPELTAETIREGWLHSGDLGRLREDGFLEITGRVKDMIKVGGFNVAPAEVEDFLIGYPKVGQVSVVGVPDSRLIEVPAAFVILKKGEMATVEEIIDFCKEKLANIKVPRYVFFVNEFPLTPQMKVQKFKLREQANKELGLQEVK